MARIKQTQYFLALAVLAGASPAFAQQDYDAGKTPAQLFASDCASCHKTPAGLAKSAGMFGVERFLREHYTSSRQSAAALARYLEAVGDAPAGKPTARRPKGDQPAKGAKGKPGKPEEKKTGEEKPGTSAVSAKPAESKPAEEKPAVAAPPESKPAAAGSGGQPAEKKPD